MVKRYNPHAKLLNEEYGNMDYYAECNMEQEPEGEFVKYEAYRLIKKERDILKYGLSCVQLSKKLDIEPENLREILYEYCKEHVAKYGRLPESFTAKNEKVIEKSEFCKVISLDKLGLIRP